MICSLEHKYVSFFPKTMSTRNFFFAALAFGCITISPNHAEATVIGNGSIDWNWDENSLPDGGLFPHTTGGPFGLITETDPASFTRFYFDSDYDSSGTVGSSTVTAKRTPSDNTEPGELSEGSFTATTTSPTNSTRAQYGFGEFFYWYGDTLPGISVDYFFQGTTDSENDELYFGLQFGLRLNAQYIIEADPGADPTYEWDRITIYSDYDGIPENGETLSFSAEGANQVIGEAGTKTFIGESSALDYIDPEKTYVRYQWFAEYDFAGYGRDFKPSTVPEPATLALMGFGLASIAYRRRRSKKAV